MFLNSALHCEINREAAEPMSTFVMRTGDRCQPGAAVRFCCGHERCPAWIIVRQHRGDSFQHPRATQV